MLMNQNLMKLIYRNYKGQIKIVECSIPQLTWFFTYQYKGRKSKDNLKLRNLEELRQT